MILRREATGQFLRVEGSGSNAAGAATKTGRDLEWSIYMARAQSGDSRAYRQLLTEITPYMRRLVGRYQNAPEDIEDTIQDILLTIHSVRRTYDATRPFTPWLVALGRRRIIDRLRQQRRSSLRETSLLRDHETISDPQSNLFDIRADGRSVREAVGRLPPCQRTAITLLKLREMSLKEAAEHSGMTITALKVATHRAMKSLRAAILKEQPA